MAGNRESRIKRRRAERLGKIFGNAFLGLPKPRAFMRPFLNALHPHGDAVGVTQGGSGRRHVRGMSRAAHPAAIGGLDGGSNANSNAGSHGEDAAQH